MRDRFSIPKMRSKKHMELLPNDNKYPDAYDDPDVEVVAKSGLKLLKAKRALQNYEQYGEPVFDKKGFYEGRATNLAHHEELKKNLDANRKNTKDKFNVLKNNDRKLALNYPAQLSQAIKEDNEQRELSYKYDSQGDSASKDREEEARAKKGNDNTIIGNKYGTPKYKW